MRLSSQHIAPSHRMRHSLYDALEVNSSSSTDTIKAALRAVVRRFWAVPRDASGDSEEAVRFAALAASILVDPIRRKDYDAALNPGVGAGPWRLPIAGSQGVGTLAEGGTDSRILSPDGTEVSQLSIEATVPKALPGVDALADPLPDGKAWDSPWVWGALGVAWLLLWYGLARPFPEWLQLTVLQALVGALIGLVLAYLWAAWISRSQEVAGAAAGLSRLAIIKWRREGSIFIGAPAPQHDTSWIFKLRLMELTRTASGFVTSSRPWRRLAARLVDYALIAVVLYVLIDVVDSVVPVLDAGFVLLRSALVLPMLTVLVSIPAGAFFHHAFGASPGKWLFSLQLVTGVTRPADHDEPTERKLLWSRATRAAWSGAALGVWPIALWRLPRHMRLARDTETVWERNGDSVVMARPPTAPAFATGIIVLLAAMLILLSGWRRDYVAAWPDLVTAAASLGSSARTLLGPKARESDLSNTPVAQAADRAAFEPPVPVITAPPAPIAPTAAVAVAGRKSDAKPAPTAAADANLAQQASAAQARRSRIDSYTNQAAAARRSGSYSGLQGSCQRWTQDQPASGEAWRCYGLAQFQAGAGREALPALRQALKFEPHDAQVEAAILSILRP